MLPDNEMEVLLVAPEETAMLLRAELGRDDLPVRFRWKHAGSLTAVEGNPDDADVILVSPGVRQGLAAVEELAGGEAPVVAIMEGGDLAMALAAIRAGAEDVLDLDMDDVWGAVRRIRFAVARRGRHEPVHRRLGHRQTAVAGT